MPQKDQLHFILGKCCHLILEWFHQQYIEGCLLPYHITMQDAYKVAMKEYGSKMNPEMKSECWEITNSYLRKITKDKNNGHPFNVLAVEKSFDFPIVENIILRGAIDIIYYDDYDGVLHVADYKTTKNEKYLTDFTQLLTYAFVIQQDHPEITKIRGSYILLRHDSKKLTQEFSLDQILSVKQKYIDYATKIQAEKEFKASPSNLCSWCGFLEHCEQGRDEVSNNSFGQQQKVFGAINW